MSNGYKAFCIGEPDEVIPITLYNGKTVYHGVREGISRLRVTGPTEIVPGFWRRKK